MQSWGISLSWRRGYRIGELAVRVHPGDSTRNILPLRYGMKEEVRRQGCEPETREEAGIHRIREEERRKGGKEKEQG